MRKKENESFSDVINRVMPYTDWAEFVGVFSKKSANKLEKSIKESRKETEVKLAGLSQIMRGVKS